MAVISGLVAAAAGIAGAAISASGAKKAAKTQASAADRAAAEQRAMFEQTRADLAPYRTAGAGALPVYQDSLGLNGAGGYANALSKFQTGPAYQFQFDEGVRGLENSMAARGKLFSGQAGKAITAFGQGLANQEFGGWQNRLAGLTELGQNASAQTGALGAQAAAGIAGSINDAGAARASGYVGTANAYTNALAGLAQIGGYGYGGGFANGAAAARGWGAVNKGIFGTGRG